ncbi:hypothetical protein PVAND_012876 [Polypedilum vanderplanki]|uniref:CHK kinase-like domain-containing protein n=1 Tax=Polypedilum vanderplanki TaxID=319348 RepID=A0A9J6CPR3_POLVA|nr:hypothetical protein PVAND_012876 [Polypedilum vanderplanki]
MSSRDAQSDSFLNSDVVDNDFFISIVERKLNIIRDKFKLRLILISPAIGKNENFVSIVYRAKIKIELLDNNERQSVDVILKVLLSTLEEFKKFSVFPRERFMYENIIASFEKIWIERANEKVEFAPRCIKFETDPYEIIVLDDLKANGYEMLDRKIGLNLAQSKLALNKLAKFHAASAIRYQKDGIVETFLDRKASIPPEMMTEENSFLKGFMEIYYAFIEAIRSFGDCDKYADKIAAWDRQKILGCWVIVAEPMRCGFTALNHGDFWLNNMLFKGEDINEPNDMLMIDFQGNTWAGPGIDLHYFIVSSVINDVKVDKFDELIKYYHDELVESLTKLKYDQHIPTLDEVYTDLMDKAHTAVTSLFFIMFVTKYDHSEEINLEVLMKGNSEPEFYQRIFHNENYKKALKQWLPFMDERGYLDVMLPTKEDKQINGY